MRFWEAVKHWQETGEDIEMVTGEAFITMGDVGGMTWGTTCEAFPGGWDDEIPLKALIAEWQVMSDRGSAWDKRNSPTWQECTQDEAIEAMQKGGWEVKAGMDDGNGGVRWFSVCIRIGAVQYADEDEDSEFFGLLIGRKWRRRRKA